jgi:hypothetical protein
MEPTEDPSQRIRVSDADREQVAEILRTAAGDGRLDSDELDERLGAAYTARTVADLVPLTADLPDAAVPYVPPTPARTGGSRITPVAEPTHERGLAIMSGYERRGDWLVPHELTVMAIMGGANLDLRRARFSASEVVIVANAVMGGVEIVVNPQTRVIVEGTAIMGGFTAPHDDSEVVTGAPTVRVRGIAFWGGVDVTRKA